MTDLTALRNKTSAIVRTPNPDVMKHEIHQKLLYWGFFRNEAAEILATAFTNQMTRRHDVIL